MTTKTDINAAVKCVKKEYGIQLTNQKRLGLMPVKRAVQELENMLTDPLAKYIDVEAWLKSTDPEMIYTGEDALCIRNGHIMPCKVIDKQTKFGNEYATIILLPENEEECGVRKGIYNAPISMVKPLSYLEEIKDEDSADVEDKKGEKL